MEAKSMKEDSTMAKTVPAVACESHYNSGKQQYTAAAELSESEINAVMQLIQLSSADSCSDQHRRADHHEEDDNSCNINNSFSFSFSKVDAGGKSVVDAAASSSIYSSSSSRSVAAVLSTESENGELLADEDHDGDDRSDFGERRKKRYRSIVELYRVTNETLSKCVVRREKKKMQQLAY